MVPQAQAICLGLHFSLLFPNFNLYFFYTFLLKGTSKPECMSFNSVTRVVINAKNRANINRQWLSNGSEANGFITHKSI